MIDVPKTNARKAPRHDRDDDSSARELLAAYLEPEGYEVMMVSSGTDAIEGALRLLPDLIVTDVMMPGAGGLQTLFVLKNTQQTAEIPTIVVSGVNPRILDLMPATRVVPFDLKIVEANTALVCALTLGS